MRSANHALRRLATGTALRACASVATLLAAAISGLSCGGGVGTKTTLPPATVRSPTPVLDALGSMVWTSGTVMSRVRLDDGKLQQIVRLSDSSAMGFPAVSPDGLTVAFTLVPATPSPESGYGSDIYVVGINGGNPRRLVGHERPNEYLESPTWLSNDVLAFGVRGVDANNASAYTRVDRINRKTGERSALVEGALRPAASPDGRFLAFDSIDLAAGRETLVLTKVDGSERVSLTPADGRLALITSIAISPDNSRVLFAAYDQRPSSRGITALPEDNTRLHALSLHPGAQDVWSVSLDGTNFKKLADLADVRPSIAFSRQSEIAFVVGAGGVFRIDLSTDTVEKARSFVGFGEIARLP